MFAFEERFLIRICVKVLWILSSSLGGLVDLGGADEREPGIENGLGLFDMFALRCTFK